MTIHSIRGVFSEEMIDQILADSFPASDPPPWTAGRENQRRLGLSGDRNGGQWELRVPPPGLQDAD